jgi:hypothetical protein
MLYIVPHKEKERKYLYIILPIQGPAQYDGFIVKQHHAVHIKFLREQAASGGRMILKKKNQLIQ